MPINQGLRKEVHAAARLAGAPDWLRDIVQEFPEAEASGAIPAATLIGPEEFFDVKVLNDIFSGVATVVTGTLQLVLEGSVHLEDVPLAFLAPAANGPAFTVAPFIHPRGLDGDASVIIYPKRFFLPHVLPPPTDPPVGWGVSGERTLINADGTIVILARVSVSGPGTLLGNVGFQLNVGRPI